MVVDGYDGFLDHVFSKSHENQTKGNEINCVCPICEKRPGGNSTFLSCNFIGHLSYRHGAGFDGYRDNRKRFYTPDARYEKNLQTLVKKIEGFNQ